MASRSIRVVCALLCTGLLGIAGAQAAGSLALPASQNVSAYRAYASSQAEMLARMTKVLARDIREGDVAAAQNDYAMTHKYLARIEAAASKLDPDLDRAMDASVEGDPKAALDPSFSGFHRIEHDLFSSRSTSGLAVYADRLREDALQLHQAIATQAMSPDVLVDGAAETIKTVSAHMLRGGNEPYSRTDLWDIEATLEGAREVVDAIEPQVAGRDPLLMARISSAFAGADARVAQYRAGCGFKSFDELSDADKTGLRDATAVLARELSKLKAVPAVD